MPKIKPILIFIITSIALHWWILSLPLFKRIHTLDIHNTIGPSPTVIAKLNQDQPIDKAQEKKDKEATKNSEADEPNKPPQVLPTPSLFRGSPWMRRPSEFRTDNLIAQPSIPWLTQVNQALQNEDIDQAAELECKRTGIERLFRCLGSSNPVLTIKIEKALNQIPGSSIALIPNCISLHGLEKKWHAQACHS